MVRGLVTEGRLLAQSQGDLEHILTGLGAPRDGPSGDFLPGKLGGGVNKASRWLPAGCPRAWERASPGAMEEGRAAPSAEHLLPSPWTPPLTPPDTRTSIYGAGQAPPVGQKQGLLPTTALPYQACPPAEAGTPAPSERQGTPRPERRGSPGRDESVAGQRRVSPHLSKHLEAPHL